MNNNHQTSKWVRCLRILLNWFPWRCCTIHLQVRSEAGTVDQVRIDCIVPCPRPWIKNQRLYPSALAPGPAYYSTLQSNDIACQHEMAKHHEYDLLCACLAHWANAEQQLCLWSCTRPRPARKPMELQGSTNHAAHAETFGVPVSPNRETSKILGWTLDSGGEDQGHHHYRSQRFFQRSSRRAVGATSYTHAC